MKESIGPLQTLLDFEFKEFITIRIIRILYIIMIVLAVIAALGFIGAGFQGGVFPGVLSLILSPVVFLIGVLVARVYLELIMVVFRINDNTRRLADAAERSREST